MATSDSPNRRPRLEDHYQRIQSYLSRYETPSITRDDLTQATYLKAYEHLRNRDPPRRTVPWLLSVARSVAIDAHRKRQARQEILVADQDSRIDYTAIEVPESIEHREDLARLPEAVRELSPLNRDLVTEFYFFDRSGREISRSYYLSPGAV